MTNGRRLDLAFMVSTSATVGVCLLIVWNLLTPFSMWVAWLTTVGVSAYSIRLVLRLNRTSVEALKAGIRKRRGLPDAVPGAVSIVVQHGELSVVETGHVSEVQP